MDTTNDAAYRHERLTRGAFQEPDSLHLHIDIGPNVDVLRELRARLVQFGETPKESIILDQVGHQGETSAILSMPVSFDEETVTHLKMILRHLYDLDIQDVAVVIERVLGHIDWKGIPRIADSESALDPEWIEPDFEAEYPGTIELHHSVKVPKGTTPPFTLQDLATSAEPLGARTWSLFGKPDTWSYRSTAFVKGDADQLIRSGELAAILRREYATLGSIVKKLAPGASYSVTAEQVIAQWTDPLEPETFDRSRHTLVSLAGVADRGLPNFADVIQQCREAPAKKPLAKGFDAIWRIMANLQIFHDIVWIRGLTPIAIELALIPPNGGEYFASQVGTFAASKDAAENLLQVWRDTTWVNKHDGHGQIMPHPETYRTLYFWVSGDPLVFDTTGEDKFVRVLPERALGEQLFSLTPDRQYKPVEDAVQSLYHGMIVACPGLHRLKTGLLAVPFEGSGHRGCLFVLVSAPDFDSFRPIKELALSLHIMLLKAADKKTASPAPVVQATAPDVRLKTSLRIQQARDHHKLWAAIEGVATEYSGRRIAKMAVSYPDAFRLFDVYPQLKALQPEIETAGKITDVVEEAWRLISGTGPRSLFKSRKAAGIPPRKHL